MERPQTTKRGGKRRRKSTHNPQRRASKAQKLTHDGTIPNVDDVSTHRNSGREQNAYKTPDITTPHLATTVPTGGSSNAATTVSTAGQSRATSILSQDSGNIHDRSKKILPIEALVPEVIKMVENKERAELMILELMRKYTFSFPRLKELLSGKFHTVKLLLV
jgi:hypothetical protein